MSTTARPTFDGARGGQGRGEKDLSAISKQYSSRDLPSHTKLKYRDYGQGTIEELRNRDFRKELEEREREREKDKSGTRRMIEPSREPTAPTPNKRQKVDQAPITSLDADDPIDDDESDSSSDEDDAASLVAELQRIKKERAAEQVKKEMEKKQEEERIRMENILSGNPLLNYSSQVVRTDMKVRRRWDDDVVFKNCARSEPKKKHDVFINDSLRSEFHKKFMEKYVK
ncbi:protein CWC15 homolog B [Chelonus insularis]|uniref:protein CWC15 homolog B n=1 Tax=Chelonus insularis TaxID=460826 RepID=UPI00158F2CB6|nr:protein CWC15 homolog B [Chelonus insularis]